MSDLIYRHAVSEDGEPVAVTEWRSADSWSEHWLPGHATWALILPGDTVQCYGDTRVVECVGVDYIELAVGLVVAAADLTLVCGEPSELRRQNPAWRWD